MSRGGVTREDIAPLSVLRRSRVLNCLSEARLLDLAKMARVEHYASRTLLVPRKGILKRIYYIDSGQIELALTSRDGKGASVPLAPGRWATWVGCLCPSPVAHDIWSAANTTLVSLPAPAVREMVSESPAALMRVVERIGAMNRMLFAWTLSSTVLAPEKRLGCILLTAVGALSNDESDTRSTTLTHTQLGHLGIGSRQRVGRLLQGLQNRGLIEIQYRTICIPSVRALDDYVYG